MTATRKKTMTTTKRSLTLAELEALREEGRAKIAARPVKPTQATSDKPIEVLLATHSVVDVLGHTRVVSFDKDGKVVMQRKADFEQFNAHIENSKKQRMKRFWKEATRYRGLICEPASDELVVNGKLNTWRGWNVTPAKGDWSLMRAHLEEVVADGDRAFFWYFYKWLAWMVQNPGKQAEVAVFVRGGKGDGKGVVGKTVFRWFGDVHARHIINPDQITGRFNAQMQQCSFLFADEAILPKDKKAENVLKGLITEDTINVEKKGIDGFSVPNLLHIYGSTNEKWVVPASHDERRYAVQTVSAEYRGNKAYFTALYKRLFAQGGCEAMLYHMLYEVPLGDWHPRYDVPETAEMGRQKLASLQGIDRLILEACDGACLPEADDDKPNVVITTGEALGVGFWAYCKKNVFGLKFETSMTMSGILRTEWGCKHWHSGNQNGIKFPPLAELRAMFEAKYGKQAWSAKEEDWVIG